MLLFVIKRNSKLHQDVRLPSRIRTGVTKGQTVVGWWPNTYWRILCQI